MVKRHSIPKKGATLAELLIALAILGVISTFSIPKILYSQTQQRKMAVFKESIASIQNILVSGRQRGELDRANNGTYLLEHLNAIKICPTDSSSEGCWDAGVQGALFDEYIEPGVTLASGAVISGFNDSNINVNGLHLDWNGTQGPNIIGDDQLLVLICIGPAMCTFDIAGSGPKGPGSVGPFDLDAYYSDPSTSYDNRILFEKIFE